MKSTRVIEYYGLKLRASKRLEEFGSLAEAAAWIGVPSSSLDSALRNGGGTYHRKRDSLVITHLRDNGEKMIKFFAEADALRKKIEQLNIKTGLTTAEWARLARSLEVSALPTAGPREGHFGRPLSQLSYQLGYKEPVQQGTYNEIGEVLKMKVPTLRVYVSNGKGACVVSKAKSNKRLWYAIGTSPERLAQAWKDYAIARDEDPATLFKVSTTKRDY